MVIYSLTAENSAKACVGQAKLFNRLSSHVRVQTHAASVIAEYLNLLNQMGMQVPHQPMLAWRLTNDEVSSL